MSSVLLWIWKKLMIEWKGMIYEEPYPCMMLIEDDKPFYATASDGDELGRRPLLPVISGAGRSSPVLTSGTSNITIYPIAYSSIALCDWYPVHSV
ncbi:hypothetical protein EVAR_33059_1 [Eumeta japonica]|uniref:Uncharacterized protein n=1 Tax=Eumeta variegata TaxID=151549 RepID=A0A4C1WUP1_EUMVA|nr:hypothetical protein EVAR_33059_1 [Eumeta japonica]